MARMGRSPSWVQIGVYSAVLHYLKAVEAAGTLDRDTVAKKLRAMPVDDAYVSSGTVRSDGRMLHEMLLTQVRSPDEMKGAAKERFDVFKVIGRIPAEEAARPLDGSCPSAK
ncbi:hypothetical protein MPEAHAMD_5624 [Methylobacterium frigidaeris]|uniref:Leucine-binding protein domain-containing protein n=1 Tax=Methylobacterium frigidaeris TaxID=2038277 RepID=A0AA37HH36_9HYPH|nr:hypothetical protein MPEAHAMD_5624 [Methylobacterium frigidaeris]